MNRTWQIVIGIVWFFLLIPLLVVNYGGAGLVIWLLLAAAWYLKRRGLLE
ncbi:MAG: hypothetical protein NVS2B16_37700 [Chloroflexota bacterium]